MIILCDTGPDNNSEDLIQIDLKIITIYICNDNRLVRRHDPIVDFGQTSPIRFLHGSGHAFLGKFRRVQAQLDLAESWIETGSSNGSVTVVTPVNGVAAGMARFAPVGLGFPGIVPGGGARPRACRSCWREIGSSGVFPVRRRVPSVVYGFIVVAVAVAVAVPARRGIVARFDRQTHSGEQNLSTAFRSVRATRIKEGRYGRT
mmetsp:Transcript_24898/g.68642  ORF Transcript_24898/g.68642 Transcript_24898/m.68642 type:complete len:203 (-) Transcript_24898:219-827(-)